MEPILDRLLLASLSDAHDPFALERHAVQSILYFGDGGLFPEEIKLYHRPVGSGEAMSDDQLDDGIEFLRESLRAGRRVLAVGTTGATIAAAYLLETGFNRQQALRLVAGEGPKPDLDRIQQHETRLRQRATTSLHNDPPLANIA